ncbi:hypothetical protein BC937DRAFT_91149 [Endogone sp. FLAS-F59071]|nr:hypothetical protein BC937DRAFT_91149 [Endogone sp. FLAS-F59071]|eukprot:RUS16490.1 hypothetical protein BC937DRAFT_91149 [Endogone sp. FLAS-F59071]
MADCNICLESLASEEISCTPCGHLFHYHCIIQWLESGLQGKQCCPTCKQPAPPKKLYRIFLDFEAIQAAALSEDSSKGRKNTSNNDRKDAEIPSKQAENYKPNLLIECKVFISQFAQHDLYSFPQSILIITNFPTLSIQKAIMKLEASCIDLQNTLQTQERVVQQQATDINAQKHTVVKLKQKLYEQSAEKLQMERKYQNLKKLHKGLKSVSELDALNESPEAKKMFKNLLELSHEGLAEVLTSLEQRLKVMQRMPGTSSLFTPTSDLDHCRSNQEHQQQHDEELKRRRELEERNEIVEKRFAKLTKQRKLLQQNLDRAEKRAHQLSRRLERTSGVLKQQRVGGSDEENAKVSRDNDDESVESIESINLIDLESPSPMLPLINTAVRSNRKPLSRRLLAVPTTRVPDGMGGSKRVMAAEMPTQRKIMNQLVKAVETRPVEKSRQLRLSGFVLH